MSGITPSVNTRYIPPDLADILYRRMRDISAKLNCHSIGTIQTYDPTNQTATVLINFQKTIKGVNSLNNITESSDQIVNYPILVNVPVVILQGGGGYLSFPIAAGDTCILLFCDRDMDIWFEASQIAPPNSDRLHSLNDAIAIVGIKNLQNSLASLPSDKVQLQYKGTILSIDSTGFASFVDNTGERLSQSGDLKPTARSTAPSGWLLAYGQSLATASYPTLFAAIGYTYGGSGANFNVPDLRGRSPIGIDNMGGSSANVLTNAFTPNRNTLGGAIGEETHQLTVAELAAHSHRVRTAGGAGFGETNNGFNTFGLSTEATGGDQAHYNVQPGMMFNWVIKI